MYTVKSAMKEVEGLSEPSKMPGYSYNLPAQECNVGSKLIKIIGSVCADCYALKGRYRFPNVKDAQYRRLHSMLTNPKWVSALAFLINWYAKKIKYFRWHDSGDLQSLDHLKKIVKICKLTPTVKHWLPTRELQLIRQYKRECGEFPDNLTVRVSAAMVDGKPLKGFENTSTVVKSIQRSEYKTNKDFVICPSSLQDNKCKDCRACWDKEVSNVAYIIH